MNDGSEWVGLSTVLQDGAVLKVVQVKMRETGPWVSYTITYHAALPRKLVMPYGQFAQIYGGILLKKA